MASKILYTDLLKNVSEERFGISRKTIQSTIARPAYRYDASLDGLKLGLYLKKYQDNSGSYYLLVATRIPDVVTLTVDLAFIVPETLLVEVNPMKPLDILEMLSLRFGLDLTIEETSSKFFLQQAVPLVTGVYTRDEIVRVQNPADHSFALQSYFRLDSSPEHIVVKCALAYCIDIDEYTAYLDQWRS